MTAMANGGDDEEYQAQIESAERLIESLVAENDGQRTQIARLEELCAELEERNEGLVQEVGELMQLRLVTETPLRLVS